MSRTYDEYSIPQGDRTIVMRSPKLVIQRNAMDYWGSNPHLRWLPKRILLRLALKIMRRWGSQYMHSVERKVILPIEPDTTINASILRQMKEYGRDRGLFPPDLVFLIGSETYHYLINETSIGLPDYSQGWAVEGAVVTWRNMRGMIIPNMEGVIVVPKTAINDALALNNEVKGSTITRMDRRGY